MYYYMHRYMHSYMHRYMYCYMYISLQSVKMRHEEVHLHDESRILNLFKVQKLTKNIFPDDCCEGVDAR